MKLQITLTQGQYDHLYNIMCSQDEIIDYLNESEDFDVQTFDNLFDIHTVLEDTKREYEKKLEKARAKQPKAEW